MISEVASLENEMVQTMMELIKIPALAPEIGGEGESKKAKKLANVLKEIGFDKIEHYDAEDERVPSKVRPNIIAYYYGEDKSEKLWIVTHIDVVPPGEESLWTITKPYEPIVKEGRIYGRGSEDNGQSLVSAIFAVKALKNLEIKPKRTVALAFVADEEMGSRHGIRHLINQGLFKEKDLLVVPDGGKEKGDFIEVAEKSLLFFRVRTIGKQVHASIPDKGLNAHRVGMNYVLSLDRFLHEKYSVKEEYFDPPESTFEPTKKDKNVDAVNIVPGDDIVYFDCRILPRYNLDEILKDAQILAKEFGEKYGAKINVELLMKNVAPEPTDVNSRVVLMLKEAVKTVRKIEPKVGGIGGSTCAAFFRRVGLPAVVWGTADETAHQPNEYSEVENLVNDAKVFALLAIS